MRCNSMKNRSRFTWIINNRRCDARSTVALSVNCDCKQTVTGPHPAPLHNNAEESRAELSQKRRPEAFCTCFIWHSQITHKHTRAHTQNRNILLLLSQCLSLTVIVLCGLTNDPHLDCGPDRSRRRWVHEWCSKLCESRGESRVCYSEWLQEQWRACWGCTWGPDTGCLLRLVPMTKIETW